MRRRVPVFILAVFFLTNFLARPLYAGDSRNMALIFRGAAKTIFSAFQIPAYMLQGSTKMFPIGIAAGAVQGSVMAVAGTLSGALDIARGAAPYGKYALFFI